MGPVPDENVSVDERAMDSCRTHRTTPEKPTRRDEESERVGQAWVLEMKTHRKSGLAVGTEGWSDALEGEDPRETTDDENHDTHDDKAPDGEAC